MASQNSKPKQGSDPPIETVTRCQGTTKKGQQCRSRAHVNNYCGRHVHLFKFPKPDECLVCLESSETMYQPLSCGHWVCRNCITKWKAECPVCRAQIQVTKRERKQIENLQTNNNNETDSLTIQAIASFLQNPQEDGTDEPGGFMDIYVDDSEEFDAFTAMILSHMNNMQHVLGSQLV